MIRSFGEDVKFEKNGNTFTFYVNDRELCKTERPLGGGSIGYIAPILPPPSITLPSAKTDKHLLGGAANCPPFFTLAAF